MEIAYHIGAHGPDGDRLLRSLLADVGPLAAEGVAVPGPSRYRDRLREAVNTATRTVTGPGTRNAVLHAITGGAEARRLILSSPAFLGAPARLFEGGRFLGVGVAKVAALQNLFADDRVELFLGIRSPATFLPALWRQSGDDRPMEAWMHGVAPEDVSWADAIAAMREAAPRLPITVWCAEDAAFLWGDILTALAGEAVAAPLSGRYDLAHTILSPEGVEALGRYRAERPPANAATDRRMLAAFLDRFARPEEAWQDVQVPAWFAKGLDRLDAAYDADLPRIAALPGVRLLRA